uniref:Uncharacterized protein n=1 Tax=Panagrolaimus sp. PS1159 TaxID=55785 RepID=A0AC35FS03_9BILA
MSSFNSSNLNDRSERSAISEQKRKKHLHSTFYFHRRSSTMPDFDPKMGHARSASVTPTRSPFLPAFLRQLSKRSPRLFRGGTSPVKQNSGRKNVYSRESPFTKVSRTPMGDISKPVPEEAIIIENSGTQTPDSIQKQVNNRRSRDANTEEEMDQLIPSTTDTETASAVGRSNAMENETPSPPIIPSQGAIISRSPMSEQKFVTANVARQLFFERNASIDENQELLVDCTTVATTDASGKLDLVIENENAKDETPKHQAAENRRIKNLQNRDECGSPSVSFNIKGKTFFGGREAAIPTILPSTTPFERNSRRRSSCMENWSESNKPSESIGLPSSVSSNMI